MPRVLIAEDDKPFAAILQHNLQERGIDSTVAHDGAQALELLRNERFDLLIVDQDMPKLDGLGLVAAMRQDPRLAPLPAILITACFEQFEDVRMKRQELGLEAVLTKPFRVADLVRIVSYFAEGTRQEDDLDDDLFSTPGRLGQGVNP